MKEKLIRFMQGRYGVDTFSKVLLAAGVAGVFISALFGGRTIGNVCYALGWAAVIYCYFRIFSKNHRKRYEENQWFLNRTYKLRCFFQKKKNELEQRKHFRIYKCPSCSQKIRVPKGKGKIEVSCPKCQTKFIRKS